jgi:dolichyl-phosphate beta-glucosyltransferase
MHSGLIGLALRNCHPYHGEFGVHTSTQARPSGGPGARARTSLDLELVVPAFNEAKRLPATLRALVDFLEEQEWRSRIVVVDNGSTDNTVALANAVPRESVDVVVIGCSRPGKGAAVRRGVLSSTSRFVGFADADLSTPVSTLTRVMAELETGAAAVIASRHAPGARLVHPQSLGRRVGGTAFRVLARQLVHDVHDTQCGFKFFARPAVQRALSGCWVNGFAFDVELLRQIQRDGGRIVEVPVAWTNDLGSTFRPVRDGLAAFGALVQLYHR